MSSRTSEYHLVWKYSKPPTYEPSSCKLAKVQTCTGRSSHALHEVVSTSRVWRTWPLAPSCVSVYRAQQRSIFTSSPARAEAMAMQLVLLFSHSVTSSSSAVPGTVARQAPLSTFPRQEYRDGLPFSSLGDLSNPGIEPKSPALTSGSLTTEPPGKLTQLAVLYFSRHCTVRLNTFHFRVSFFILV